MNRQKIKSLFLLVAPLPALILFKFWAGFDTDWTRLLILSTLLAGYCGGIVVVALWQDRSPTYLDLAAAIYFVVISVSLSLRPWDPESVLRHVATGMYGALFLSAFLPPLLKMEPFTMDYARVMTPEDAWEHPIFLQINRIMSWVWSGIFALCLVLSLYPSIYTRAVIPLAVIVLFGIPFNKRFPDLYLKRLGLPSLAEQRHMDDSQNPKSAPTVSVPKGSLPETAWEAISKMPLVFDPEAAGDLSALIAFDVYGAETFRAFLLIDNGTCSLLQEPPRQPDLTIETPASVWLSISRRELDGQKAFMEQAFKATGNLGILLNLSRIFRTRPRRDT